MDALKLFQEYMGTGLIVLWFLVSLLYLWLTEKRKYIRVMFLYVPLVLLLVFFNPLVAKIVSQMADGEIYYRILWLLPVTPVIAFGTVQLCGKLAGRKRYVGITLAIVLFTISGSLIYRNPNFQKAENAYHVPQSVVDENGDYVSSDMYIYNGRDVLSTYVIKECYSANIHSVSFMDNLYGSITEDNADEYLVDNLHLNVKGRKLIAKRFEYFLNYYSKDYASQEK